jgi:co-chaperonin GroES (HSP10)
MAKKLFVPERMAKSVESSPVPTAISKGFENLEDPNQKNTEDPSQMDLSAIDRLPQPVGYRLLVIPYYMKKKSAGGIIIPDSVRERESFATVAAYVVKVGPDAYCDANKFPTGAWCDEKSWVLMGRYAGNRFKVDGLEVRLINDDNIIATILDPADISYV